MEFYNSVRFVVYLVDILRQSRWVSGGRLLLIQPGKPCVVPANESTDYITTASSPPAVRRHP